MTRYILRRLALMIPVAFLASVILFVLLKLTPGDPVLVMLGERATAENYEALRHDLGLDAPYPIQYLRWAGHVAQGDLGKSLRNGTPVRDELVGRLPATFQPGIAALLLGLVWPSRSGCCRRCSGARRSAGAPPPSPRSGSPCPASSSAWC